MTKAEAAIYAAGVFDSSGAISANRPIASALKDTKKHEALQALNKVFKGELQETEGQGRGAGKIFVQWRITNNKARKAFFTAIRPYSVATTTIDKHLESL